MLLKPGNQKIPLCHFRELIYPLESITPSLCKSESCRILLFRVPFFERQWIVYKRGGISPQKDEKAQYKMVNCLRPDNFSVRFIT